MAQSCFLLHHLFLSFCLFFPPFFFKKPFQSDAVDSTVLNSLSYFSLERNVSFNISARKDWLGRQISSQEWSNGTFQTQMVMIYRLSAGFRLLLLLLTSISTASHEVTAESTKSFKANAKVPGITWSLAFPPWDWSRLQSIVYSERETMLESAFANS